MEKGTENTRVTLIGIIVEDPEAAIRINGLLHAVSYTHLTLPTTPYV